MFLLRQGFRRRRLLRRGYEGQEGYGGQDDGQVSDRGSVIGGSFVAKAMKDKQGSGGGGRGLLIVDC